MEQLGWRELLPCWNLTLQRHNTENSKQRIWAASVPISTFMCLWAIYAVFRGSVCLFRWEYIKCSQTEYGEGGNWEGRPHNSYSGNTFMGFSLQCIGTTASEQTYESTVHFRPFQRGSSRYQIVKQTSLAESLEKERQSQGTATTNSLPEAL